MQTSRYLLKNLVAVGVRYMPSMDQFVNSFGCRPSLKVDREYPFKELGGVSISMQSASDDEPLPT